MKSSDIGQFIDTDGRAYLIFERRPAHGFAIARLSADCLSVSKLVCLVPTSLEGGALVHFHHRYYVIGSRLSGWSPIRTFMPVPGICKDPGPASGTWLRIWYMPMGPNPAI